MNAEAVANSCYTYCCVVEHGIQSLSVQCFLANASDNGHCRSFSFRVPALRLLFTTRPLSPGRRRSFCGRE